MYLRFASLQLRKRSPTSPHVPESFCCICSNEHTVIGQRHEFGPTPPVMELRTALKLKDMLSFLQDVMQQCSGDGETRTSLSVAARL
jgi:hypothetical protein